MIRGLWIAAALIVTPAVAADQFDLVCTAKKTQVRYRVDLAKGEWCQDDCHATVKIASVTTATLTLMDRVPQAHDDIEQHIIINRSTGGWYSSFALGPDNASERRGICSPQPFSGFPATKF